MEKPINLAIITVAHSTVHPLDHIEDEKEIGQPVLTRSHGESETT
jgi:hypothetical protein